MENKLCKILLFILLMFGNSLLAQEKSEKFFDRINLKVGLDIGYTSTSRWANLSDLVNSTYVSRCGLGINLATEYLFYKNLFVSTGVSYLQKNYQFERSGIYTGWYTEYHHDFINVPLLLGAYIFNQPDKKSKGIWAKIAVGVYGEYLARLKTNGNYPVLGTYQFDDSFIYAKHKETYDFKENMNQLRRHLFGLQGQAQLGYSFELLEKRWNVYSAFNYQYGLSDITFYNNDKNRKNTMETYMISVGLSFKF